MNDVITPKLIKKTVKEKPNIDAVHLVNLSQFIEKECRIVYYLITIVLQEMNKNECMDAFEKSNTNNRTREKKCIEMLTQADGVWLSFIPKTTDCKRLHHPKF